MCHENMFVTIAFKNNATAIYLFDLDERKIDTHKVCKVKYSEWDIRSNERLQSENFASYFD